MYKYIFVEIEIIIVMCAILCIQFIRNLCILLIWNGAWIHTVLCVRNSIIKREISFSMMLLLAYIFYENSG